MPTQWYFPLYSSVYKKELNHCYNQPTCIRNVISWSVLLNENRWCRYIEQLVFDEIDSEMFDVCFGIHWKKSSSPLYYRMFWMDVFVRGQWGSVSPACVGIAGPVVTDSSSFFLHQRCKVELCRLEHLIKDWASDRRLKEKTATRASLTLNGGVNSEPLCEVHTTYLLRRYLAVSMCKKMHSKRLQTLCMKISYNPLPPM